MRRVTGVVVALLALAVPGAAQGADTRAGVAKVDATWHVGASAGQFTDDTGPVADGTVDPYLHTTKKRISDGVALRTSTRALVVEDVRGHRIAVVSNDLYLSQDFLNRRLQQVLRERGLRFDAVAVTSSHNHNTPFYSTPGWGTAIFQDVVDVRFYEYMATRMADAVQKAAGRLVPVRMGGTTRSFDAIQSHTYGPKVGDDGTPAGQPWDHTTKQLSVLRFDDVSDPARPKPLATWVTFGVHPEWTWGYDLVNGDITHAAARMLDREIGSISVWSQRETGASGPHKDTRVHRPEDRREFQDNGFGQLDRGARMLADAVKAALRDIEQGTPQHPSMFQPFVEDFRISSVSQRFAPPATRPYPGVSNCNTASLFHGDPRLPVLGLPDCQSAREYLPGELFDAVKPVTAPLYSQLKALGVPVPESYSATALTAVEETAAVHLMVFRLADTAVTFCPCEQFTDTALNIQTRLDRVAGNLHVGFDWTKRATPDGRAWCVPGSGPGTWSCADPRDPRRDLAPIDDESYRRFRAQINNDATGWEADLATLGSEAEPKDPAKIKGNFTHEEHTKHGYRLAISVGMANDYWGYVPEYREYRSHDHYRKALHGLGPHGADFLATRLSRMAASLNGGSRVMPSALDQVFLAEQARAEAAALGLGTAARAATAAYERTLGAEDFVPRIDKQPADVSRFGAAHLRFTGGSNYTDLPDVRVERLVDGRWERYGDMDGDVQLMVGFPRTNQLLAWRTGQFRWYWTASFEAFSSDVAQPDAAGAVRSQTPEGTYRFVADGWFRRNIGQRPQRYHHESRAFRVGRFDLVRADDMRVEPDGRVSLAGTVDYPDSYASPFRFINPARKTFTYGLADASRHQTYCPRCSFRPWADRGAIASVTMTVNGQRIEAVRDADGRFRTPEPVSGRAIIEAGDLVTEHGETNSERLSHR